MDQTVLSAVSALVGSFAGLPRASRQVVLTAFREPERRMDPLKPFSDACRRELASLYDAATTDFLAAGAPPQK